MANDLLEETLPLIAQAVYRHKIPLLDWRMKEGDIPGAYRADFKEKGWTDIRTPFEWGGVNKTVWFRTRFVVPDHLAGSTVGLRLHFPEALLFVNGKPTQGLDGNRSEVILFEKARRNQEVILAVEAYAGRGREKQTFALAELVVIDTTARVLHTSLQFLRQLELKLPVTSPEAGRIRELIRRSLIFVKYFAPAGDEYPNAIARAVAFLRQSVGEEFSSSHRGEIHLIGQSHIDLLWLWRFSETIRKTGRTFSSTLRLLERFPGFRFSQSQPALYEMARAAYPTLWNEIRAHVSSGRWEAVGPLWVEPDCNLPSGESLVRQLLVGSGYFRDTLGVTSSVCWLPDTFGYAWSLPQILKRSGISSFFTTKLRWNDTSTFPHTSFWWQGIDGTRILSHMPPLGLEAGITAGHLLATTHAVEDDELAPPVMQTFGYGDGGGGVTAEQLEAYEVIRNIPGLAKASLATPSSFFKVLEERSDQLPVWNGELYLERHRGTYTTHGWVKRSNRMLERALYAAELLAVLAEVLPGAKRIAYPAAMLEKAWRSLLTNQFHDIITGTFIKEGRDDIQSEFDTAAALSAAVIKRSAQAITSRGKHHKDEAVFTMFNPTTASRRAYVEFTVPFSSPGFSVESRNGSTLDYQVLETSKGTTRLLVYVPSLPSVSLLPVTIRANQTAPSDPSVWKVSIRAVEGPVIRARFDGKGALSAVYDRKTKKDVLQKGKRGNVFQTFNDAAPDWQTWDIEKDIDRRKVDLFQFKTAKVIESGPLRATIRQEYRSSHGSVIQQDIHFYHATSRVDFDTRVRWKESGILLKAAFPLAPRAAFATYEIQFGAIDRPNRSKIPADKAKFEVPAQRWACLSDGKSGAALINDSKHGYDCRDHVLRLSLIRSPHFPHAIDPARQTDPSYTDQGDHRFSYALFPFDKTWKHGGVVAEAEGFNTPPLVFEGAPAKESPSFLTVSKANIIVTAVKRAEDGKGYIVRAYESHGQATDAVLSFAKSPSSAAECDLMERNEKIISTKKNRISARFKPFEIRTFRVLFAGKATLPEAETAQDKSEKD